MSAEEESAKDRPSRGRRAWRVVWRIARVLLLVYVGLAVLLFFFQSKLIYFPTREIVATPKTCGLEFEEVHFQAADGVKLHGWFVPAAGSGQVLLFCHGNAGNISTRLSSIEMFNLMGLTTFFFDYRGYGRSEGSPSEEGTYLDAEAAWRYLTEQRKIAPVDIVIHGRSLGGPIAANLATKISPQALIVESALASVPDMGEKLLPFMPVRLLSRFDYATVETVRNVSCPILVIHSRDDELIPFAHGRRIFEAANEPKRFVAISGSHNDGFIESGADYINALSSFLAEYGSK